MSEVNKFDAKPFPSANLIKVKNKLKGAIRNDIPSKKVYLYSFDSNTEELLYDFDLRVGDMLFKNNGFKFYRSLLEENQYPTIHIDTVWVSRIDSVLLPHDNLYHKRFNFTAKVRLNPDRPYEIITSDSLCNSKSERFGVKINPLIEGLGPDYDPMTKLLSFESSYSSELFCRSINNKVMLGDTTAHVPFLAGEKCNSIITQIDEDNDNARFLLYPNPSNGKFDLVTTETKPSFFEIYNLLGVKILRSKIESSKTEIDLSSQSPGVYFIRAFYNDATSVTKKIMIE